MQRFRILKQLMHIFNHHFFKLLSIRTHKCPVTHGIKNIHFYLQQKTSGTRGPAALNILRHLFYKILSHHSVKRKLSRACSDAIRISETS